MYLNILCGINYDKYHCKLYIEFCNQVMSHVCPTKTLCITNIFKFPFLYRLICHLE